MSTATPPELCEHIVSVAKARGALIAVAESVTGGLIAQQLTSVPGASQVFLAGVVAYSERMKCDLLGVDAVQMSHHGVVSEWTAAAMARGVLLATGASHALATTGVAGPGAALGAAAGRVCLAVATADTLVTSSHDFAGNRDAVRAHAADAGLRALLDVLS